LGSRGFSLKKVLKTCQILASEKFNEIAVFLKSNGFSRYMGIIKDITTFKQVKEIERNYLKKLGEEDDKEIERFIKLRDELPEGQNSKEHKVLQLRLIDESSKPIILNGEKSLLFGTSEEANINMPKGERIAQFHYDIAFRSGKLKMRLLNNIPLECCGVYKKLLKNESH
jgi:hypothetical protein